LKFFVKNTEKNTVETFDTFEKIYTNNIYFDKTEQKYIPKKDEMYTKELYQNVKEKYAINFATRLEDIKREYCIDDSIEIEDDINIKINLPKKSKEIQSIKIENKDKVQVQEKVQEKIQEKETNKKGYKKDNLGRINYIEKMINCSEQRIEELNKTLDRALAIKKIYPIYEDYLLPHIEKFMEIKAKVDEHINGTNIIITDEERKELFAQKEENKTQKFTSNETLSKREPMDLALIDKVPWYKKLYKKIFKLFKNRENRHAF